jgi:uncharacterized protein (TIGR03435 family)
MLAPAAEIGRSTLLNSTISGIGAGAIAMAKTKIGIAVASALVATLFVGGTYELAAKPGGIMTPTIKIEQVAKPTGNGYGRGNLLTGHFEMHNVPAKVMLAISKEMPASRMVWKTQMPSTQYDVQMENMFATEGARNAFLAQHALAALGLTAHKETITTEVLLMKYVGGGKPGITDPTQRMCKEEAARIKNKGGADLSPVQQRLEDILDRVVIDETGLTGRKSYDLRWHATKPQSITTSLKSQLGIDLVPATRQVEVLVIEKAA